MVDPDATATHRLDSPGSSLTRRVSPDQDVSFVNGSDYLLLLKVWFHSVKVFLGVLVRVTRVGRACTERKSVERSVVSRSGRRTPWGSSDT